MMTDLARAVREAGVVGAGGAGFPTHVKLAGRPQVLIINGAECEPLLRVDQELMAREQAALAAGLAELIRWLHPEKTYLALKGKHRVLAGQWREILSVLPAEVFELGDFYPAGDEHVLVHEVTGMVVPPAGIPLDAGVLVLNVETLFNIARALEGLPVTEKHVTIAGAVARPKTVRVPVGISFGELVNLAGGAAVAGAACLEGGPMMGRVVTDWEQPVTKTTKGVIVLPSTHRLILNLTMDWPVILRRNRNSCENCRMCTDLCPRYLLGHPLEVHRMMRYHAVGGGLAARHEHREALLCSECGLCEKFSCPVGIFPRAVAVRAKRELAAAGVRYPRGQGQGAVRQSREDRRVPSGRLIARIGLQEFDRPAPLDPEKVMVETVRILLQPPFGSRCRPTVRKGQPVQAGDLVGEIPEGAPGARMHASISGLVTDLTPDYIQIRTGEGGLAG
ncbi:MAG: 4Fe-4S dicluster domain-containing protein [Desulfocucumaceae bacterium]